VHGQLEAVKVQQARPLGIQGDLELDGVQLRSLVLIAEYDLMPVRTRQYDLMPVRTRLLRTNGRSIAWVNESIFEFRRYLALRRLCAEPVSMVSGDVDDVWHACLLFTRIYADLCERAFGYFVHHDPVTEHGTDLLMEWQLFDRCYRHLFGVPGPLWLMWEPLADTTKHETLPGEANQI
jgi:hypothetical protein